MTYKESKLKARELAKQSVKNYFKSEPTDMFDWDKFGSSIIKQELEYALSLYIPSYNSLTKKWCVLLIHGNEIVAE
jgi:hypothetical protein